MFPFRYTSDTHPSPDITLKAQESIR